MLKRPLALLAALAVLVAVLAAGCGSNSVTIGDTDGGMGTPDGAMPEGGSLADATTPADAATEDGAQPDSSAADSGDAGSQGDAVADAGGDGAADGGGADAAGPSTAPFNGMFNGDVQAIVHAGNSWYVGGDFTIAQLVPARNLLSIDLAGVPSTTCNPGRGFDLPIFSSLVVGNAIYIGGDFNLYNGVPVNRIVKLDATTCALDTTFSPATNGFDGRVGALATLGTSLYVGGNFTAYRGVANASNHIAKLDLTTGAIDTSFSPPGATANGFDGDVHALLVVGTSVYAGGLFTSYKGVASSANYLAKLDAAGAIDTTFSPVGAASNGFNQDVTALVSSGTSLYVGGFFRFYRGVAFSANYLAKLDLATGAIDTTFSPAGATTNGMNNFVQALAVSGTSLYVGGGFTAYKGVATSANRLAKLDATNGVIDTTFSPAGADTNGFNNAVNALAVSGTSLYAGGVFTDYRGMGGMAFHLAKLDLATGAIDTSAFRPFGGDLNGPDGNVFTMTVSGNSLWLGGSFTRYGGSLVDRLVKLDDVTYVIDRAFSPPKVNGVNDLVFALAASPSSLYVGGRFTSYRGLPLAANRLAKLDLATGAIDTAFSPAGAGANGFDNAVDGLLYSGNALYVGGSFDRYKGVADSAHRLAKLDATTGAIDTTFSPPGVNANGVDNGFIRGMAISGTSLYITGGFTSYRGGGANSANGIAKLDTTTGAIDTTFSPPGATANGFDGDVLAVASIGNALYVGGDFRAYRGVAASANYVAKLDPMTGAIDTTFGPAGATANGFDGPVFAFASLGSSVYVGGFFNEYRGVPGLTNSLAKLDQTTGAVDTTFTPVANSNNGFDDGVDTIAVSNNSVFVGGGFT